MAGDVSVEKSKQVVGILESCQQHGILAAISLPLVQLDVGSDTYTIFLNCEIRVNNTKYDTHTSFSEHYLCMS